MDPRRERKRGYKATLLLCRRISTVAMKTGFGDFFEATVPARDKGGFGVKKHREPDSEALTLLALYVYRYNTHTTYLSSSKMRRCTIRTLGILADPVHKKGRCHKGAFFKKMLEELHTHTSLTYKCVKFAHVHEVCMCGAVHVEF
eukprot:1161041-Pelagomonas_calceolata.AAC.3